MTGQFIQSINDLLFSGGLAHTGYEDLRGGQVGTHIDIGYGNELQLGRGGLFTPHHISQFTLDLIGNPFVTTVFPGHMLSPVVMPQQKLCHLLKPISIWLR
jgi:hypothetical protein